MGETRPIRRARDVLPKHLERRPSGIYSLRFDVPQRLRSLIGQRKIVASLGTRDLATALARFQQELSAVQKQVAAAELALQRPPDRLSRSQLGALERQMAERLLARYQLPPTTFPLEGELPEGYELIDDGHVVLTDSYMQEAVLEVSRYRAAVADGAEAMEAWRADQLHRAQRLLGEVWSSGDAAGVAMAHHRATVLALRTSSARHNHWPRFLDSGEVLAAMPDPAVVFPTPALPVLELAERWISARRPQPKTATAVRACAARLVGITGLEDAAAITGTEARLFRDARLSEVAASTARKDLALLKVLWAWATGEELLPADPWTSVKIARGDAGFEPRLPFSTEQIEVLLNSAGTVSDPAGRWAWPLGLMLGLRIEEIACLRRDDLVVTDGVICLQIRPEAQVSGRLKTRSSERTLPLPAALLALGFADWAQAQPAGFLFEAGHIPASDPRRSHGLSISLGKALRRWGIADRRLVFHSCRHSFSQRAVAADLPDRLIQSLMGHSQGKSMTARYSGAFTIAQLKTAIDSIDWPTATAWRHP